MVVLVVAIIALRGSNGHTVQAGTQVPSGSRAPAVSSSPGASTASGPAGGQSSSGTSGRTSGSPPPAAAAKQPLVVLNNTTITGLAEQASERFEAGGWTVTKYDNYQNDILSTCAYYDPDDAGAKAAARALQRQFPTIKRVEPQFAELAVWHSPIVVILMPDYSAD